MYYKSKLCNSPSHTHINAEYYCIACRFFANYTTILIRQSSVSNLLHLDPAISLFLYGNNSTSYYKTIHKGSFHNVRKICLDMGGDLAIVGIQQNNIQK